MEHLSIGRFYIMEMQESLLNNQKYYHSFIRFMDREQNQYFEGMAEGLSKYVTRLRAAAEAYERACYILFMRKNPDAIDSKFPYGIGVGLRSKSAIKRAFGEYYERLLYTEMRDNLKSTTRVYKTTVGKKYVSIIESNIGFFGSGYGDSVKSAEDSALRSIIRYKDYPVDMKKYELPSSEPSIIRLTLENEPWLECYYIGFTK